MEFQGLSSLTLNLHSLQRYFLLGRILQKERVQKELQGLIVASNEAEKPTQHCISVLGGTFGKLVASC